MIKSFVVKGENMKIIIASDSYKGSCSTLEVANSIERGFKKIYKDIDIIKLPIADGGEGTVEALVIGTNGKYERADVVGPLGEITNAKYGIMYEGIGIIEMAAASGITIIDKDKLNPMISTSYGTGQLIKDAMDKGMKKIYVGLGGSATNDGGVGMAQALGISFTDENGIEIGPGGGELRRIKNIDISNIHSKLKETEIIGITDVQNTLCGIKGASYIFGPQKGATDKMVKELDANLKYLANLTYESLGKDIINIPGSGAAGGLGAGLIAFCNGTIEPGIDKILDIIKFDDYLKDADLVITGEGRIDNQSKYGKGPIGVAKRAKKYNIPVIAIVGSVGEGASDVYSMGIDLIIDIVDKPMTLENAIKDVETLLENAGENAARVYKLTEKINYRNRER